MRKGNIAAHEYKIYVKKRLITLSTKIVYRIAIRIVIKPRYRIVF